MIAGQRKSATCARSINDFTDTLTISFFFLLSSFPSFLQHNFRIRMTALLWISFSLVSSFAYAAFFHSLLLHCRRRGDSFSLKPHCLKIPKMSHFFFSKMAFFNNSCPIKSDLSGKTVWLKAVVFKNWPNWLFLAFFTNFCPIKSDLSGKTVWP